MSCAEPVSTTWAEAREGGPLGQPLQQRAALLARVGEAELPDRAVVGHVAEEPHPARDDRRVGLAQVAEVRRGDGDEGVQHARVPRQLGPREGSAEHEPAERVRHEGEVAQREPRAVG